MNKTIAGAARRMLTWMALLAAVTGPAVASAQSDVRKSHTPVDIVLVHGAFADGSSWSRVIPILQRKGYRVTAVQNPLSSLAADVDATNRVIERQPHAVLLVGHSWGGAVISEAGNHAKVRGLVYLSALAPDSGESVGDSLARLHAPMDGMAPDAHGLIWLDDPRAYAQTMAADVAPDEASRLAAVQQPIAAAAFGEKIGHAAWKDKPSWYLVTEGDRALPPAVQRQLAAAMGSHTQVLRSSHMSLVSHPDKVADLIDRVARSLP